MKTGKGSTGDAYPIIIAGSRDFNDYELLRGYCEHITSKLQADPDIDIEIVSGGATGADSLGERWAQEKGFHFDVCPALWRPNGIYDKSAGYKRNLFMASQALALIAFWDGVSDGTRHMINIAREKGLKVAVKRFIPVPKQKPQEVKGI